MGYRNMNFMDYHNAVVQKLILSGARTVVPVFHVFLTDVLVFVDSNLLRFAELCLFGL